MGKIKGFLFAVRHREILMIWDKQMIFELCYIEAIFFKTLFSCVSRNATRLDRLLPAGALAHFAKSILVHSHRGISRQKNTRMAYRQSMTFTALPLSIAFTMSWATLLASSCKG